MLWLWNGGIVLRAGESLGPTLRSSSGQFVVAAPQVQTRVLGAGGATNELGWIDLEAPMLVLTCERVKRALLWEFGVVDQWRGTIYVVVNGAMTNNQPAVIAAQAFLQGWQYRVEVPPRMEPSSLIRGLVHVLLLEIANRQAGPRSAEVPLWLSEGLMLHLVRSSLVDLAVPPPRETLNRVDVLSTLRETRRPDSLAIARERLKDHAAMSVARMGEVVPESLAPETWKTFQASAQLFVHSLLQLQGGRSMLFGTVYRLAGALNWQSAFLESFESFFPRMLDVEKWWSVMLVHFTNQDPLNAWSIPDARAKLADVLQPPIVQSLNPAEPPQRTRVSLQQVIKEWEYSRQAQVLQGVVNQLMVMRVKLPPEMVSLADDYRQVLSEYSDSRRRLLRTRPLLGSSQPPVDRLVAATLRQLDELDLRRLGGAEGRLETSP